MKESGFVPLGKRTKKAQKAWNKRRRGTWDGVLPVTKIIPDKKKKTAARKLIREDEF